MENAISLAGKGEIARQENKKLISRILIVEDEKLIGLSLEGLVRNLGYEIAGNFSSGEEALAYLEKEKSDLVLMDIHLAGGRDGIETAQEINTRFGIPFIFISAFTDTETIERAKRVKPYGYLIKPFDKKYLSTSIELALYRNKAEQRLRKFEEDRLAFMKAIPDLLFVRCNLAGVILEASLPENFAIPVTHEQVMGLEIKNIKNLIPGIDENIISESLSRLQKVINEKKTLTREFKIKTEKGTVFLESTMVPAENEEVIAIVRDVTARKKAETAILEAIVKTQDDERKRFAQDLHDSIGQMLTAAKFKLDAIDPKNDGLKENKANNLISASGLLGNAIAETRAISHGLMPEVLNAFGLEAALEELCASYTDSGKVDVHFHAQNFNPLTDSKIQIGLYRVSQELLNNAYKHAKASKIKVELIGNPKNLALKIEDNGIGFSPEEKLGNGFGLKSVSARIAMLSGEIKLERKNKAGMETLINIPLEA